MSSPSSSSEINPRDLRDEDYTSGVDETKEEVLTQDTVEGIGGSTSSSLQRMGRDQGVEVSIPTGRGSNVPQLSPFGTSPSGSSMSSTRSDFQSPPLRMPTQFDSTSRRRASHEQSSVLERIGEDETQTVSVPSEGHTQDEATRPSSIRTEESLFETEFHRDYVRLRATSPKESIAFSGEDAYDNYDFKRENNDDELQYRRDSANAKALVSRYISFVSQEYEELFDFNFMRMLQNMFCENDYAYLLREYNETGLLHSVQSYITSVCRQKEKDYHHIPSILEIYYDEQYQNKEKQPPVETVGSTDSQDSNQNETSESQDSQNVTDQIQDETLNVTGSPNINSDDKSVSYEDEMERLRQRLIQQEETLRNALDFMRQQQEQLSVIQQSQTSNVSENTSTGNRRVQFSPPTILGGRGRGGVPSHPAKPSLIANRTNRSATNPIIGNPSNTSRGSTSRISRRTIPRSQVPNNSLGSNRPHTTNLLQSQVIKSPSGTIFNLAGNQNQVNRDYQRATRESLSGSELIKVKNISTKNILRKKLTTEMSISSFDPLTMKETGNVIRIMQSWRNADGELKNHLKSMCMDNVFELATIEEIDGIDQNGLPTTHISINTGASVLDAWNQMTIEDVVASCDIYRNYASKVDQQNLDWSYSFLLNNCDDNLRESIIRESGVYGDSGCTGPVVYHMIANVIVKHQANFSHNIISMLMVLGLTHFEGESVPDCVSVLRNALTFLNYGHARFDQTPTNIMDMLQEVFLRCSNEQFTSWLRMKIDFNDPDVQDPYTLFKSVRSYYDKIQTKHDNVWLPTRKKKASFQSEVPRQVQSNISNSHNDMTNQIDSLKKQIEELSKKIPVNDNPTPTKYDKNRNGKYVVDRNPPGPGEPHERINAQGYKEYWCSKCPNGGRWGNHNTEGHDEWYKEFIRKKKEKEERAKQVSSDTPVPTVPQSMSNVVKMSSAKPVEVSPTITQDPKVTLRRRPYVSFVDSSDEEDNNSTSSS